MCLGLFVCLGFILVLSLFGILVLNLKSKPPLCPTPLATAAHKTPCPRHKNKSSQSLSFLLPCLFPTATTKPRWRPAAGSPLPSWPPPPPPRHPHDKASTRGPPSCSTILQAHHQPYPPSRFPSHPSTSKPHPSSLPVRPSLTTPSWFGPRTRVRKGMKPLRPCFAPRNKELS